MEINGHSPFRQLLSVFLLISCQSAGIAQSSTFLEQGYEVEHYGPEYGFPYDEIEDFLLDSQGYLWMVSSISLIRYNGIEFEYFRPQKNQRDYNISEYFASLTEDHYGNIWIGTFSDDVWKFDRTSETFERIRHRSIFTNNYPDSGRPHAGSGGGIWVNSQAGILRIDPLTSEVDTIFGGPKAGLINELFSLIPQSKRKPLRSADGASQILLDQNHSKYLVAGIGAFVYHADAFSERSAIVGPEGQEIWAMKAFQSMALDDKYRICFDVLDLKKGRYTIEGGPSGKSSKLTLDALGKTPAPGIYLLPIDEEVARQLEGRLASWQKEGAAHLTAQNSFYKNAAGVLFLISESQGIFEIKGKTDGFYLEKKAERIQFEGAPQIRIDQYTEKDQESLWVWGHYFDAIETKVQYFLGIWNLRNGQFTKLNLEASFVDSDIMALQQDRNGNLWIGSFGKGLYLLKPTPSLVDNNQELSLTHFDLHQDKRKSPLYIKALYMDNANNLFVGTRTNYLYKINLDPAPLQMIDFRKLGKDNGKSYQSPVEDASGNIWFSSLTARPGIIQRYNTATANIDTFEYNPGGSFGQLLHPLYSTPDGSVLFGGSKDLIRFKKGRITKEVIPVPGIYSLNKSVFSPTDSTVFFLLRKESPGLSFHIFNYRTKKLLEVPASVGMPWELSAGKNGAVYMGTQTALFEVDMANDTIRELLSGLPYVFAIHEDDLGRIWLGTFMGLAIWGRDKGKMLYLDEKDGLENVNIHEIEADDKGFLWLFSFQGVFRVDPRTLEVTSFPQLKGIGKLRVAGHREVMRDANGYFNVFSENGFYFFHPDSLYQDTLAPIMNLQRCHFSNGKGDIANLFNFFTNSIPSKNNLSFPYFQNNVTIDYVGIQFNDPKGVSYRYRLQGLSDSWEEVGSERTARFQGLSPGKYTFSVAAANTYGVSGAPLSFEFRIRPPWYWTWWSKGLYLLLAMGLAYLFYRFQLNKQLAEQESFRLKEIDEIKNRLYTNITHEFRTPLTVIQGMAQLVTGKYQKEMRLILRNSRNLLHLVNQMLDLSKLDSGKLSLHPVQGDIVAFMRREVESYMALASSGDIQFRFLSTTDQLFMDFDVKQMRQIIANLLSNAIKFTDRNGAIEVSLQHIDDVLEVKVADTGKGIPSEQLPQIFDRFYQVDDGPSQPYAGTGIGLALTKELVELMDGQIGVESKLGAGTSFTIRFPVRNSAPLIDVGEEWPGQVLSIAAADSKNTRNGVLVQDPNQATVLIIEDNEDIIEYLTACLQEDYQVVTALNGKEGIQMAIKKTPDIIISDIMMPEVNGLELTQTLKNDERTSHIPIILLTAKAGQDSKVEGLQRGADAYLTKPFDKKELMVRMDKLIALRKTLQEKYAAAGYFKGNESAIDPKEDLFLQKLQHQVEMRLEDGDFGIEGLAKAMSLSRSQLYRKTKALTGQSASSYLRAIRLHHGRQLLQKTDLSIAEVAYRVGFNDPAYFSKTYAEQFGYPPVRERT
ncbi:MAG: response regulator [Lewinellaceae bacterium]|nr:response regulator [Lewinellaceae bacterium]